MFRKRHAETVEVGPAWMISPFVLSSIIIMGLEAKSSEGTESETHSMYQLVLGHRDVIPAIQRCSIKPQK